MKLSLLDITQKILSSLDSDPVNSISDTVESMQVADIVKECYYSLMAERDWPFLHELSQLEGLSDVNNPTKMRIPESINKIKWVKYNKKDVQWLPAPAFHKMIMDRVSEEGVINSDGYIVNADPVYWTSYDDDYVVFDGINLSEDSTLYASKSSIYAVKAPVWQHIDTFVPDLPDKFFPTLLAESKSQAFVELKQTSNAREEQKARRGRVIMQNESWRNEFGEYRYNTKINYGRR
jgi:hypothetical protein